jgi:hypothetical protein
MHGTITEHSKAAIAACQSRANICNTCSDSSGLLKDLRSPRKPHM